MILRKYKVTSVSGNSCYAGQNSACGDEVANSLLAGAGFVDRNGNNKNPNLYIGCEPARGDKFFVYYCEPESNEKPGSFRLVKLGEYDRETVIDRGTAGKAHTDPGVFTFYAQGADLESWSFHCDPEVVSEEVIDKEPKILIIQTTSSGRRLWEESLTRIGLKEDTDFRFINFGDNIKKLVASDRSRLLIIGSQNGRTDFIPEFVSELKAINPKLTVLGYSYYTLVGVDGMIKSGITYHRSMDSIQTSVQYYTVPGYKVMGWKERTWWV